MSDPKAVVYRCKDGRPDRCGYCGDRRVDPHCASPTCRWAKCHCRSITGFIGDRVSVIPSRMPT